jgi:glycosyltransferase involved in cell wall biosynthesis
MYLCYLLEDTALCGGVKVVFEQAQALQERGHEVKIVSKGGRPDWYDLRVPLLQVDAFLPSSLPECDFMVGTFWTTVRAAFQAEKGCPVHLCQGYEGDFPAYAPYRQDIEAVYRLPVIILTVHEPLTQLLWYRFGKKAYTVGQGIDHTVFFPGEKRACNPPWRVLVVGPYEIDLKGVREALRVLEALKKELPLRVVRVSQFPFTAAERHRGVTDEYHFYLRAQEMAAVYRSCNVLLAPYWAQEGFGLPVLEAMACGVPTVVSDIPALRAFAQETDWTLFFAERDIAGMQRALRRLLEDSGLWTKLRARGIEIARSYTFSHVAERIEHVLTTKGLG